MPASRTSSFRRAQASQAFAHNSREQVASDLVAGDLTMATAERSPAQYFDRVAWEEVVFPR
jgi:hypothetical protein